MIKVHKFPTLIGLTILLLGIGVGVFLVNTRQVFRPEASPSETPKNVRVTNITNKSFTVSWNTTNPTTGFVNYGKNASLGSSTPSQFNNSPTHYVTVENLSPNTTYLFKIGSNGTSFDNEGEAYQTKTSAKLKQLQKADVVFGSVTTAEGAPREGAIIYLTFIGASPISVITDIRGRWVATLSEARTTNLESPASYNTQTNLEIFVRKDALFASARIPIGSAKPVPAIALGKNYNFSDIQTVQSNIVPASALEIPRGGEQQTPTPTPTPTPTVITTKPLGGTGVTVTPTPKPTATPTAKPSPTPSSSQSAKLVTPVAGDLTPTILTFIMGLTLFSGGLLLTKAILS